MSVEIQSYEYGVLLEEDAIKLKGGPFKNKYFKYGDYEYAVLTPELVDLYLHPFKLRKACCIEAPKNIIVPNSYTKLPYMYLNTYIIYPRKLYYINVLDIDEPLRFLDNRALSKVHIRRNKVPRKFKIYKGKTFRTLYTPARELFLCDSSEQIECQILTASALYPYFTTIMEGKFDNLTFGEEAQRKKPNNEDIVKLTKNLKLDDSDDDSPDSEHSSEEDEPEFIDVPPAKQEEAMKRLMSVDISDLMPDMEQADINIAKAATDFKDKVQDFSVKELQKAMKHKLSLMDDASTQFVTAFNAAKKFKNKYTKYVQEYFLLKKTVADIKCEQMSQEILKDYLDKQAATKNEPSEHDVKPSVSSFHGLVQNLKEDSE